jgi:hypothetical protein
MLTNPAVYFALSAMLFAIDLIGLSLAGAFVFRKHTLSVKTALTGAVAGTAILSFAFPMFYTVEVTMLVAHGLRIFAAALSVTVVVVLSVEHGKAVLAFCGRMTLRSLAFAWREAGHLVLIVHDLVVMGFEAVTHRKQAHA